MQMSQPLYMNAWLNQVPQTAGIWSVGGLRQPDCLRHTSTCHSGQGFLCGMEACSGMSSAVLYIGMISCVVMLEVSPLLLGCTQ